MNANNHSALFNISAKPHSLQQNPVFPVCPKYKLLVTAYTGLHHLFSGTFTCSLEGEAKFTLVLHVYKPMFS